MKIEASGADSLAASFDRLQDELRDPAELVSDLAKRVQREARAIVPKRSGRLASSIGIRRISRGEVVRTSLPYAQYVHYGSIHNPRPVPFLELAARRAAADANRVGEQRVDQAIARAGL